MPRKLRAATAGEAVEGLKAVEALKAAIEAAPVSNLEGYRGPEAWGFIVYLGLCERMGSAIRIRILEATAALESDGSIEIQGVADYTLPPEEGIAAEFETPWAGTYACTVRLSRRGAFIGLYEFAIDNLVLGNLGIDSPTPANYTFVVRLGQGNHAFRVRTHGVSFWFYSLTVFHIPELAPA
ncbi:MAG: hypothetical protein M3513_09965 [Actinomycetota bacterium]|nr:hypothetical protein [Actinomycetota bacterium]